MKITIISGSQRLNSQSRKVAEYVKKEIQNADDATEVFLKDLAELQLPFFDDALDKNNSLRTLWTPLSSELESSDAFVFITPEWDGMASPMLKNFFLYTGKELIHKPALLISVTGSTTNGAYPISELRASSYKNNLVCYIPNHVIVRNVKECLNDMKPDLNNKSDIEIRSRIEHSIDVLMMYAKSLNSMRNNTDILLDKFKFGM